MKNGNLYKVMAMMMALVFISAIGFAQSGKKELKKEHKKEQTMMIQIEIDDDGNTTSIDTIIVYNHDMEVEMQEIIVEVNKVLSENHEKLKEIKVDVLAEMEEGHGVYMIELSEKKEEMEKAFKDLQKELEGLEIEKEARERIEQAMETLESVDWESHAVSLESALISAHHKSFGAGEHETINVIIEDGDTTEVHTKVIVMDGKGKMPSDQEMNVWVTDDGEKKIIIKTVGDGGTEGKVIFINDEDMHHKSGSKKVMMVKAGGDMGENSHLFLMQTADEKDIEKAQAAGLKITAENKLDITNVNVEIENDETEIALKTDETGEMKVSLLDADFKKIKQIKAEEDDGMYKFPLDMKEMTKGDSKAKYMLIEQNKKLELMKL